MKNGYLMSVAPRPVRTSKVALFLWLLPLWLAISCVAGLWLHFRAKEEGRGGVAQFATTVSRDGLSEDVNKFITFIGARYSSAEGGVRGLERAASMIEGSLGVSNAGYQVERIVGPPTSGGRWPLLLAKLDGRAKGEAPLWVVAGYDIRPGSGGVEANATGVVSVLAAAQAMAADKPRRSVVFAFLPHVYDVDSPVSETISRFSERAEGALAVLVVEATGAAGSLVVSTRDAASPVLSSMDGLGEVVGAEAICLEDDFDFSSALFEHGLSAVRVSTRSVVRSDEEDESPPDGGAHTAATRALVSLIERLSSY